MIDKIVIKNFQSHSHTEIGLSPAVTVLVGESDVGKSAVVRALRWLFLNEPRGTGFVRQGAVQCSVSVRYGDGTVVERLRDRDRNLYAVTRPDGTREVYEGFGVDVPEEVASVTGVKKLPVGDVSFAPNIAGQLEAPFLLGEPGPTAALLLGVLSRAEVFDGALKDAVSDLNRLKREARSLETEVASLEREMGEYADLPRWEEAVRGTAALLEEARAACGKKALLERLAAERAAAKTEAERCAALAEAGSGIRDACTCAGVAAVLASRKGALAGLLDQVRAARRDIELAGGVLDATGAVGDAGALVEAAAARREKQAALTGIARESARAAEELAGAETVANSLAGLPSAEAAVSGAEAAAERLKALSGLSGALAAARPEAEKVSLVARVCEEAAGAEQELAGASALLSALVPLKELSRERGAAAVAVSVAVGDAENAGQVIGASAGALADLLGRLGKCPLCFNEIGKERVSEIVSSIVE